jgi:two-component system cell cycle response regulator DivK
MCVNLFITEHPVDMPHALIIDDTPANISIMTRLLSDAQFTFTTVADATALSEALDHMSAVDIVFTDLNLDGMTGYDVLAILRQHDLRAPIVACSVYTDEIVRAREMGFDSFIGYPLKMGQFIQQVKRILNGEAVWEK